MKTTKKIKPLVNEKMRSPCPISGALDILGDKWSLLIVRDLIAGKCRYNELTKSPENIPTNILASRLKLLLENNIIEKKRYLEHPPRYEYKLMPRGHELITILKSLKEWGLNNINDTHAYIDL